MRCIEDFIINPIVAVDEHSVPQQEMPQHTYFTKADWYSYPRPPKTAALVMKVSQDPTSSNNRYTSDEEAASPVDNDSSTMPSRNGSISSELSLPELLDDGCNIAEQQCSRAQAVKIKVAGKPRMVSMPKPADTYRRSTSIPVAAEQQQKRSHSRMDSDGSRSARSSQDSRSGHSTDDSMSDVPGSPASTAPSSLYSEEQEAEVVKPEAKHQRRISRHIDLMEAARAIPCATSPYQPSTPVMTRPATFDFPTNPGRPTSIASKSSAIVRRKAKFATGLKGIGRNFSRRDSNFSPTHDGVSSSDFAGLTREVSYMSHRTSSHSSRPSGPKMVARAANERAPTIQLPAFADD